ncbi:MAG: FMN-binding protein [Spirochaetales bacterium]|nr:FMN-binding protein [Spirochaetales bacterium]
MKKGIKILLVILIILAAIIIAGTVTVKKLAGGLENFLAEVVIEPVDLKNLADGTYPGKTDAGIIQVKLEVDVKDHRITDIRLLEHRNGQGGDAEELIPRIIAEQRVDVDTVSGATYSSLAILDAVEGALKQ